MADEKLCLWLLGDQHPVYGVVVMMGILDGEAYRWFRSNTGSIAMMPLVYLNS